MFLITLAAAIVAGMSSCSPSPRGIKIIGQPELIVWKDTYDLRKYEVGDTVRAFWNDMYGEYYITNSPEDQLAVIK